VTGENVQIMYGTFQDGIAQLVLPAAADFVLPGVPWGAFDELLTPAYWRGQVWQHSLLGTYNDLRLGDTLAEEVAACLLGGYGMPADLAVAAYRRVRDAGLLAGTPDAAEIEALLSEPLTIGMHVRHYRFARQKSRYLSACLKSLSEFPVPEEDLIFRDQLAQLPGIGLKTASWIVRNIRSSSVVAVIDIHILRACRHMGLFPDAWDPQRNYRDLERRFIAFAHAINASTAMLDCLMWDYMRRLSPGLLTRRQLSARDQVELFLSS